MLAVSLIVMEILGIPGSVWGSYEVVKKLSTSAMACVGEAKIVEDEERAARLPSPHLKITQASYQEPKPTPSYRKETYDLNDDIPF